MPSTNTSSMRHSSFFALSLDTRSIICGVMLDRINETHEVHVPIKARVPGMYVAIAVYVSHQKNWRGKQQGLALQAITAHRLSHEREIVPISRSATKTVSSNSPSPGHKARYALCESFIRFKL